MNISIDQDQNQIIISCLLGRIEELTDYIDGALQQSDIMHQESTDEISALYKFIESKNEVSEMLDFVYKKAVNGDIDDINVAINTFDYYTDQDGSEDRWRALQELKKSKENKDK